MTLIPAGARHIRVAQRSRNHLALVARDGRYVLNGDGALSPPGTYEAAGTRVTYTRGAGPEETLQAAGPTSQELLLQVLLREPNPGVHFEFWLPRESYGPFQARAQALGWPLRQPQPREVEPPPAETAVAPEASPARVASLAPDTCGPCPDSRGRAHRLLHYCGSDFGETPDLWPLPQTPVISNSSRTVAPVPSVALSWPSVSPSQYSRRVC